MNRYKPENMMPDEDTEVLAYYGKEIGYVVAKYEVDSWLEAWGDYPIPDKPEYWIDLTDIAEATD